jgi:hypothetical protein
MWPVSTERTQLALFVAQLPHCINALQFISTLPTTRTDTKQVREDVLLLLDVHRQGT